MIISSQSSNRLSPSKAKGRKYQALHTNPVTKPSITTSFYHSNPPFSVSKARNTTHLAILPTTCSNPFLRPSDPQTNPTSP